jgi:hypothetical protein
MSNPSTTEEIMIDISSLRLEELDTKHDESGLVFALRRIAEPPEEDGEGGFSSCI